MTRCLIWGANSVVFAALAAHPNLIGTPAALCAVVAVACWLRGFQVARCG